MRREYSKAVRTVVKTNVERRRGRRKKERLNAIECDMIRLLARLEDVGDRVKWWFRTKVTDRKAVGD